MSARWSDFRPALLRVNRIYSFRAETMVDGLPRASRFLANFRIFGIFGFESDFGLPIGGIIRNTQVRLLNAWASALELNRVHIS